MDIEKQKQTLEENLESILKQIETVGVKDSSNPGGYVATEGDQDSNVNDDEDQATELTDFGTNNAILKELEQRAVNIQNALNKIEDGSYGTCSTCGEKIEEDRLEVLPSAKTCKAHME